MVLSLVLAPAFSSRARAALSFSDTLNAVRPSAEADHEFRWTVEDGGGIQEGEGFTLTFADEFDTAAITVGDVDLLDDTTDVSLAADCSGSQKIDFANNGNDSFSFAVCPGDGGAITSSSVVTVKIGANAGGENQIVNPASPGGYTIDLGGNGGYGDSGKTQVAIIGGISVSAQIGPQTGDLRFIGSASPLAVVYFLESSSVLGTQLADSSSHFDKTLVGLSEGIHPISIYAVDTGSRTTPTVTFSVNVPANSTVLVSGLILPPTIALASSSVKRPANLSVSGRAKSNASVQFFISGSGDYCSTNVATDSNGTWATNANPKLHLGGKSVYAVALDGSGGQSEPSRVKEFEVQISADLNTDNLVNITDFSILLYNWGTPQNVVADINDNGSVNLVDFSIMLYYWTGG